MFIAALLIIAKTQKQPDVFQKVCEWTVAHLDNEILFRNKKNELSSHETHGGTLNAYG